MKRTDNENYNLPQYGTYSASNSHQGKPPRFQRNQETHNQHEQNFKANQGKTLLPNERRNTFNQTRGNFSGGREVGNFQKNQRNHCESNNRFYDQNNSESRPNYEAPAYNRQNKTQQDINSKSYNSHATDKNFKNTITRDQANDLNVNSSNRGGHKNGNGYNNRSANEMYNSTWAWKKGDQCMAKYWEDNKYYNAQVTAVSNRTCVVQFTDFNNFEEVLQVDCIPITEDISQSFPEGYRRPEQSFRNRPPRHDQNYNSGGMEFRRGGGAGGAGGGGGGSKGYNKKRGQQRSAQPIYQPPAQRR